ncbi:MAG: hydrogenase assembly protein HupF [Rhodomicrobium sp.]|jgi:hydrogenase expression/formation protein HypC|nr:MAG: hydrogenase assembly protein HupF [Rhodomicrobium sp.]
MCLGIPGQIVGVSDAERQLAVVDVSGIQRDVNVACITTGGRSIEDCIGDWVLVHVGFAMSRIDEDEAAETLKILEKLGEVEEELEAMRMSGT